jgi:phosphoenolpyruvate carboxylase
MMSMQKSDFDLTAYMAEDKEFGDFWRTIRDEFELSKKWVLHLAQSKKLMDEEPTSRDSITMRDRIVLPLLTIQQFALDTLHQINDGKASDEYKSVYERLVTRSMFGIINAARNSA